MQSYFRNPFHGWEKGLVENGIGLVRIFLPKGTGFATITKERLQRVENLINRKNAFARYNVLWRCRIIAPAPDSID